MAQAGAATSAGQPEKALAILKGAASSYPTDKSPWLQIAQSKFDAANYGEAIVNAQEVLQRDPADKVANSIIAVSGLRLSTKALTDLSHQNNLTGTLRTEAQDLAKLLRESLGENVLVPKTKMAAVTPMKFPASTRLPAAGGKAGVGTKTAEGDGGNSNPFGALK